MNWETFKKPLIIAHRGETSHAIENTLPAIEAAMRLGVDGMGGVDGVEVDLQLTHDGEVVVFHDDTLQRLAGRKEKISQLSLQEIKKIRLGDTTIPTLKELLDLTGQKILLNLELKSPSLFTGDLEEKVTALLQEFKAQDSILISSFHPIALLRMKRKMPSLRLGTLFEKKLFWHQKLFPLIHPFSINAPLAAVSPKLVEQTHHEKRRLFVWTVNDENDIKKCVDANVDGIITDNAEKCLTKIKTLMGNPSPS